MHSNNLNNNQNSSLDQVHRNNNLNHRGHHNIYHTLLSRVNNRDNAPRLNNNGFISLSSTLQELFSNLNSTNNSDDNRETRPITYYFNRANIARRPRLNSNAMSNVHRNIRIYHPLNDQCRETELVEPEKETRNYINVKRHFRDETGTFQSYGSSSRELNLKILDCDGGDYSSIYAVSNLLKNNGTVYSSIKKKNVNILFSSEDKSYFELDYIDLKAPEIGFTSPCMDLVVFISNKPISFEDLNNYNNYTFDEYKKTKLTANDCYNNNNIKVAAFVQLNKTKDFYHRLNINSRNVRYVAIKLIRSMVLLPSENSADDEDFANVDNIDMQYILFYGNS